jgi:uncharacterized protein
MKKLATILVATALVALTASAAMAANQIRISQVYGGGGAGATTTVTYQNDYVEIFNSGGTAVNIGGWTLEYGSATGSWGSSAGNIFTFPANTLIQPCSYILVASTTGVSGNGPALTGYDFGMTLTIGAASGKVALFNAVNTNLACGLELAGTLQDKVAFGTANCSEVTAVGVMSATSGAVRNLGGMTDTDSNVADFTVTTNPVPHNAASGPSATCQAVPTTHGTWGQLKSIYR